MLIPACASVKPTSLETLALALFHNGDPGHRLMVMTAYLDESGTHGPQSPLVTVAGFLATAEQWDNYERDMASLMSEYGVRKFHAKEFRGRKGDFKNWPRPKRARFNSIFCGWPMTILGTAWR